MAGSYNHITLVGRLTRNPEIRYVQSGSAVCSFSLAINRRTKNGDEAMFIDCTAWNGPSRKLADTCNTYLKKGMTVLVDGRLAIRDFTDKDGNKRKATEVVINEMQMLDAKGAPTGGGDDFGDGGGSYAGAGASRGSSSGGSSYGGGSSSGSGGFGDEAMDDEIPF